MSDVRSYYLGIEFVTGSFTNITPDVFRVNINRAAATLDRPLSQGTMMITVDNGPGYYSPVNSSSPYYGYLTPGKRAKLTCTHSNNVYTLFSGDLRTVKINPVPAKDTATLTFGDQVDRLSRVRLNNALITDINPADLFTTVMSASNVRSFSVDDEFRETIPYVSYDNRAASDALQELLESGYYWMHNGPDETLHFKNRYFNLTGTVTASYNSFFDLYLEQTFHMYNDIVVSAQPRIVDDSQYTVGWVNQDAITIPHSSSVGFFVSYNDPITQQVTPCTSMVTPVASTDYQMFTGQQAQGTDLTASMSLSTTFFAASAVCTVQNFSGSDVYVSKFNLRGNPVRQYQPLSAEIKVSSSINAIGPLNFALNNDLMNGVSYINNYCQFLSTVFTSPEVDASMTQNNMFPDVLARDLGDLVSIVCSKVGINGIYTVLGVEHDIQTVSGREHILRCDLQRWIQRNWLVLDDTTYGKLDNATLGF